MPQVETIGDAVCRLGECPIWDGRTCSLWWVDVLTPSLLSYDPSTGKTKTHPIRARRLGSLALRAAGGLLLACDDGLHAYNPSTGKQTWLADPEPGMEGHRKNDGRADWAGNFWIGTLREKDYAPVGALYRVATGRHITTMAAGLAIPNGLAFDADRKRAYYADTRAYCIWASDYDAQAGVLGEARVFATTTPPARPDGSCIDREGFLWNAHYAGSRLARYAPDGTLDRTVDLPVSHPTCCCFGGENLDVLFVTSASEPLSPAQRADEPLAGRTLALNVGTSGRPEFLTHL